MIRRLLTLVGSHSIKLLIARLVDRNFETSSGDPVRNIFRWYE